jgi:AcrR family transcriptional regulator
MARPRSARSHGKVLDAALRLFARQGIDATSMDAIAEASGVSKATIYKHWPDKDALCLESLARAHGVDDLPEFHSGSVREDIVAFLEYRSVRRHQRMQRRLMPHFMAYAARNPAFANAWKARVLDPPRARLRELLKRAIEAGELTADLDLEVGVALLLGPMMYRFAAGPAASRLPRDLSRRVVEAFWRAHAGGRARG